MFTIPGSACIKETRSIRNGPGGRVSDQLHDGKCGSLKRIVESTELCSIAVSFGSAHSTISLPCFMSHASNPGALRDRLAPPSDLIRVSIGIEDVVDILEDLEQAIDKAYRGFGRGFLYTHMKGRDLGQPASRIREDLREQTLECRPRAPGGKYLFFLAEFFRFRRR